MTEHCEYHDDGNDVVACTCAEPLNAKPLLGELLTYVDELTRQRDDARRIAIDSGVFQDHRGTDYDLDSDTAGTEWRADPVGAVAWDKQEQQR
jgi:hypothetical protein